MTEDMHLYTHHKNYSIYRSNQRWINCYSNGIIESLQMLPGTIDQSTDVCVNEIVVRYKSGEKYTWKSKYIDEYNMGQFGIAVSLDGTKVFAQTWENGLFCLNAQTGERIWRTKSRRGITDIFVNDDSITVQLHGYAMQLINMGTGDVIKEKRPSTAWGFTALDNKYLICRVTIRKWEIIEAETLEVKEAFTHKQFTDNHTDYCIHHISLCENGVICVKGFQNMWDDYEAPPKMLPNIEFEYFLKSGFLAKTEK